MQVNGDLSFANNKWEAYCKLDRLVVSSGGHALLVADSSNNGETVFCCQASAIVNCRRFFCPFYELIKRRKTVCFPNSSCRFATSTINCFLHFLPLVLFQRFTTPCVCFFLVNYRANGSIPLQGNSHGWICFTRSWTKPLFCRYSIS